MCSWPQGWDHSSIVWLPLYSRILHTIIFPIYFTVGFQPLTHLHPAHFCFVLGSCSHFQHFKMHIIQSEIICSSGSIYLQCAAFSAEMWSFSRALSTHVPFQLRYKVIMVIFKRALKTDLCHQICVSVKQ